MYVKKKDRQDFAECSTREPMLTLEDLERLFRLSGRTLARLWNRGDIPRPIKVGWSNRWRASDIDRVLENMK
jgi:predicted DNA-binding transcriptional regulator AlpA